MAKSFSEIGKKAENLMEQGKEADRNVVSCQAMVVSANSRVAAARRQLAVAMETDEEGRPRGNVAMARAQLSMAEYQLTASQNALSGAQANASRVRQQKNSHVQDIGQHNRISRSNLEKLGLLLKGPFGADSAALAEGIAKRHNEAEDIRVDLLRSLGIEETPDYVSVESGSVGPEWKGGGFAPLDLSGQAQSYRGGGFENERNNTGIAAPVGGGLGNLIQSLFNGNKPDNENADATERKNIRYTSREELSDGVDKYACDYQANPEKYNDLIRRNASSKDIEAFRKIINNHRLPEDAVFFRRASLKDLGEELANIPLEELAGKCYQFNGIMSTSGTQALCDSVSSGTVLFEIKAPAGTPALDLTQVAYFQEAMFDSPYCYIESVKQEGNNTTRLVVRITDPNAGLLGVATNGTVTPSYIATLYNRFEKADPLARRVFDSYRDELCIRDTKYPPDRVPHYAPIGHPGHPRGVYYSSLNDEHNPRGNGATYFHELGHMIDHAATGYSGYTSHTDEFRDALIADGQTVLNAYNQLSADRKQGFLRRIYQDDAHSFSDLIDATTNGQLHGAYGHAREYWTKDGNLQAEAFAHFFEASMGCEKKREFLSGFFPTAYGVFNEMLENIVPEQKELVMKR